MSKKTALTTISQARKYLAETVDLVDVIDIRDKAAALAQYRKVASEGRESQNDAAEIKVRAERRAGELLKAMPKAKGSRGKGRPKKGDTKAVSPKSELTLKDIGITPNESSRFQQTAALPDKQFESYIEEQKAKPDGEITSAAIRKESQRHKRAAEKKQALKKRAAARKKQPKQTDWSITCGDCLDELGTIEAGTVRLIFADPPYNIGVDYGEGAKADKLTDSQYMMWANDWLEECVRVLTADGSLWVMINDEYVADYCLRIRTHGLHVRAWIKWYETFGVNCQNNFNRCSRHILYCTKNRKKFVFNFEAVNRPSDRQAKYGDKRADPGGKIWDDVWVIPRLTGTCKERLPEFPTQVPLEVTRAIIGCASDPGDLVVDPFCGSASTGVAAIERGRRFTGIEKSRKFVDLATLRMEGVKCD